MRKKEIDFMKKILSCFLVCAFYVRVYMGVVVKNRAD